MAGLALRRPAQPRQHDGADPAPRRPTVKTLRPGTKVYDLANRPNVTVVHVLEQPPPDWGGEIGYLDADMLARHLPCATSI